MSYILRCMNCLLRKKLFLNYYFGSKRTPLKYFFHYSLFNIRNNLYYIVLNNILLAQYIENNILKRFTVREEELNCLILVTELNFL